jgi:hypothetical protein
MLQIITHESAKMPGRGAWALIDDWERGKILEKKLGKNTPAAFPYIDEWRPRKGEAVSIKTTRIERAPAAVERDLKKWVSEIAEFPFHVIRRAVLRRGDFKIDLPDIKRRALRIGIEPGKANSETIQVFQRVQQYGREQGLMFVEFVEVK